MKLKVVCLCRLTKDSLLPQGDWSSRGTSQGKSGLIPFAQKEEWLEVVKWFGCKSGVSEAQVVEAELYRCSPTPVWEVLRSPQLWVRLVGAKGCCFRAGFGRTALGLTEVVVMGSVLASKELLPCRPWRPTLEDLKWRYLPWSMQLGVE